MTADPVALEELRAEAEDLEAAAEKAETLQERASLLGKAAGKRGLLAALGFPRQRFSFLTVLEEYRLNWACAALWGIDGWDIGTYHVGSSTERRDFRDVDLRTILDDDAYDAIPKPLRKLLQMSVSQLLTVQSGLPIDWQLQPMREANAPENAGKHRNAMGLLPVIRIQNPDQDI